ncbi:hypothetical protein [Frankia sp. Cr1]|uniref:hypothetical protein n=1 Tax=Frankia sp. Cr1 TaxID=3073931 RepID=UPI002AD45589|nr:hypothetical protein [Frankia sp. Cr1]
MTEEPIVAGVLRCREAFTTAAADGQPPRQIAFGQLIDAADPVVTGRHALFEPVGDVVARQAQAPATVAAPTPAGVEQATAIPGEPRDAQTSGRRSGK